MKAVSTQMGAGTCWVISLQIIIGLKDVVYLAKNIP